MRESESTTSSFNRLVGPMHLRAMAGPPIEPIEVLAGEAVAIGRSTACKVQLSDASVSRKHITIEHSRGRWVVTDEGSRHGTLINGIAIEKGRPTPVEHGDTISLGPWVFRVHTSGRLDSTLATMDDRSRGGSSVHVVAPMRLGSLAQRRLMLLMDTAAAIQNVTTEDALAQTVLPMLREGTGFGRAALVRTLDDDGQLEVLGADQDEGSSELVVSRSLIEAARRGEVVELDSAPELAHAVSIMGQGVSSALCAPIQVGATVVSCLYLDVAASRRPVEPDAAAFVAAVAKLCGLAMANLSRRSLERRQAEMMRELHAAQQVQRRMQPPESGTFPGYRFAMRAQPGRIVAGDVFGISPTPGGETAVYIGDVTSKGLGPAMIMAAIQSFLAASLARSPAPSPAQVIAELNRHLCAHTAETEFCSLWFATLTPDGRVHAVDAGHGHVMLVRGGVPELRRWQGGLLVGVEPSADYVGEEIQLAPGDRIILVSDGLLEQRGDETDAMFGHARLIDALKGCSTPMDDVATLFTALEDYAATDAYDDDVTIASIERLA